MSTMQSNSSEEPLHVLDLPQLYQKPSFSVLYNALSNFSVQPHAFGHEEQSTILPDGATGYLTSVIASPLTWIEDDDQKEELWNLASQGLSARSGRTGMGDMTRTFVIPSALGDVDIELHEPALVGDNLGFKTWGASFVLARRLHLYNPLASLKHDTKANAENRKPLILELGAGTGLLGLAAAMIWHTTVVMTDLPEIAPNLAKNIERNERELSCHGGQGYSEVLDWEDPNLFCMPTAAHVRDKASVILVADPIYSSEHPKMLAHAIEAWLSPEPEAKVFLAYPWRDPYQGQIEELTRHLTTVGLKKLETFTETVRDDWREDVTCCCEVWTWITLP